MNSDEKCQTCGKIVPLHQENHLLQHCSGIGATPVVIDEIVDYKALAKRAFAIGKRRLESNSVRILNDSTPKRIRRAEWGDRAGESLAELDPRTKRPRLNFQNNTQNF